MTTKAGTTRDARLVVCDKCASIIAERWQVESDAVRCPKCGHVQTVEHVVTPRVNPRSTIFERRVGP